MRLLVVLFFLMVAFTTIVNAQKKSVVKDETPKLIVTISIEHFRPEYIYRFWNTFQGGGFKRLYDHGAVYENTRVDIHNLKPSTVLATLSTGVYPSEHGIVGDKWYKQLSQVEVPVVSNGFYLTLGSDSKEGSVSCHNIKVSTLGDVMKVQTNRKSKVYSVAINPIPAVLMAGHAADGAFWFDKTNGNIISSSYYLDQFPDWIYSFNNKKQADAYLLREWDLLLPEGSYTAGYSDNYLLEKGFWEKWNTFPYDVKKMSEKLEYPLEILKVTPWGNKLIKDFAIQLIEQENLGDDQYPDMLSLTFSNLDFANKWFLPSSVEMQEMFLRIDQEIASLLVYLDKVMGKDNYLVVLTAASTSSYPANILKEEFNFNAGDFLPQTAMALLRSYLNALYGAADWIQMYNEEKVYLNHDLIELKDKNLDEMRTKAASFLNQFSGIKAALPAHVVEIGNMNNQRFSIIENSYCVQRSGDIILLLEEGWQPTYKYHQVDYSTENKFPLVFYGKDIKPGINNEPVELIDIVPTVAKIVQIYPPDDARGRIIESLFW